MATSAKRALRIVVPALGAVAALSLTACAGDAGTSSNADGFEGVELTVWNNIDFDPYQTLQKEYFEECAAELGVTVDVQTITGEYTSKLLQAASSGSLPDIALLSTDTQVGLLAEQGVLADLDALGVSTEGISDTVVGLGEFDGTLYALPVQVENYVLFYDTAAFAAAGIDAPPATFAELVEDTKAIAAATGQYGIALPGVGGDGSTAQYFLPFLLSAGGDPADPTSQGAVDAVTLYQQLVAEGGLSKEFVNWGWDVTDQWLGQKAAVQVSGPWNLVDTSIPFEYGTASIPVLNAGDEGSIGLLGYAYGVSAAGDAAHQEAAAALIACRASEENQIDTAIQGGYIPALTSAQEAFVAEVPAAASFVDAIENGYNAAQLGTEWNSLQQVYIDAIQDAAVNGTDPAEALEKAAKAQG